MIAVMRAYAFIGISHERDASSVPITEARSQNKTWKTKKAKHPPAWEHVGIMGVVIAVNAGMLETASAGVGGDVPLAWNRRSETNHNRFQAGSTPASATSPQA